MIVHDFRFALRSLRNSLGFTAVVTATLGLGVGLNTAIFSLVDGVLLEPLPYEEPDRVMTLWEANAQLDIPQDQVSAGTFRDWTERAETFESLGAYSFESFVLGGTDQPEQISGARVSPSILDVVGVLPALGRGFRTDEATPGNEHVVLLSNGFWTQRMGADPEVVGATLTLDDQPHVVVGVMPPRFEFPPDADEIQLWTPLTIDERLFGVRAMRVYNVVGRLGPGASLEQAQAEMEVISRGIAEENPESNRGWSADVTPALEQIVGDVTTLVTIIAGAAALVLLIGCVNIANLVLARSSATQREFAIQATLGAGRVRLLRRALAESLVLVALGGGIGILLAIGGVAALKRLVPPDLPRVDEVGIDAGVVGFAVLASLVSGVLFGLYPALRSLSPRLIDVLKDAGRGGSGGRAAARMRNGMIAIQVGLALLLVLNAGVMIRSFSRLMDVEPGFRTDGVLVTALSLPENEFPDRASQVQFWNQLVDATAALPGVEVAGAVSALPMSPLGTDFDLPIRIEGRESPSIAEQPRAGYRSVLPGYFETMEIPLVRGRLLDRFDREEGRPVMVLNESAEQLLFPGEDAIGQILGVPMAGSIEIVGVVGDVRHAGLDAPPGPELYVAFENFPVRGMHLVLHTEGEVGDLAQAVRDQIHALAPALPISRVGAMNDLVSESVAQHRFNMALLLAFAACALLLAAVGIYGVISYSVVQRTGEIGIRMAVGADASDTFLLVVQETLVYVALGGAIGLAGSFFVGRVVRGLVFEVSPLDPPTVLATALVLVVTAFLAAGLPARRATAVDPVKALSGE
jgi:putative ABC transport system permease protein